MLKLFMPAPRLSFLGPVTVTLGTDQMVTFPMKSILALLVFLAESGPEYPVPRERLAELLWPGMPMEYGRKNLRQSLYELNKLISENENAPLLLATRQTLQWNPETQAEIDTRLFEQALQTPKLENLKQAISLYRGNFLADFYLPESANFEDWVQSRREHYRNRYRDALHALISLDTSNAENHARSLVKTEPLDEEAACILMGILVEKGARTEALQLFENLRRDLKDQLGVDPDPQTITLYKQISSGKIVGTTPPRGILSNPSPRALLRLPGTSTPFIGRRPEVEQVKTLIQDPDHRLITLLGPGGTGKTRLSIQTASELVEMFPEGVFFASLASIHSTNEISSAIAKALNFAFYSGEITHRQQVLAFLQEKKLLLILDNFEHLLDATDFIAEILASASDVKLVVTTRARLNLPAEQLYLVGGMRIPEPMEVEQWNDLETQAQAYSAIQLFLERVRRVQPGFELTQENIPFVVDICRLVQGMPLGLELAAAWMELLQPLEIAAEITRSLDFLETEQAGVPDRQRSLRSVFESSWKLLSENEREAFLRLCVFVGSFSREAAQEISGASLKILLGLANKSWLQQIEGGRFQLHELMRQYGEERLQEDDAIWRDAKNRHANYFADFVAKQSERMKGPDQRDGAEAVKEEFDTNIRAAWNWLAEEQRWVEITDHMLTGLTQVTKMDDRYHELLPWLRDVRLAMTNLSGGENSLAFAIIGTCEVDIEEVFNFAVADHLDRLHHLWKLVREHELAEAMGLWFVSLASYVWEIDLDPKAQTLLGKAFDRLHEAGKEWELGWALLRPVNVWNVYLLEEDKLLETEKILLEVEKIFRKVGAPFEQGQIAHFRGDLAIRQNRPINEVETHFQRAWDFYRALGEHFYFGMGGGLATYYFRDGEFTKGFALMRDQQREYERVGNMVALADSLHWESIHAVRYSIHDHAMVARQRCIAVWKKLGIDEAYPANFIAWNLYELGEIYRVIGETDKAIEQFDRARVEFERTQSMLGLGCYQRSQGDMALKTGNYSEALDHFKACNEYFLKENHPWSIAQSHGKLALAYAYQGDLGTARAEMQVSSGLSRTRGQFDLELIALLAELVCLAKEGKHEQAVVLAAFIAHHPLSWNETKSQAQQILDWAARDLPEETVRAAIEKGKALELEKVASQILAG